MDMAYNVNPNWYVQRKCKIMFNIGIVAIFNSLYSAFKWKAFDAEVQ